MDFSNPYNLGLAMFEDLRRLAENPNDKEYGILSSYEGENWVDIVKDIAYNNVDSNFIRLYLTDNVIRNMKFSHWNIDKDQSEISCVATHGEHYSDDIRSYLSKQYESEYRRPEIFIKNVNLEENEIDLEIENLEGRAISTENYEKLKSILQMYFFDVY